MAGAPQAARARPRSSHLARAALHWRAPAAGPYLKAEIQPNIYDAEPGPVGDVFGEPDPDATHLSKARQGGAREELALGKLKAETDRPFRHGERPPEAGDAAFGEQGGAYVVRPSANHHIVRAGEGGRHATQRGVHYEREEQPGEGGIL